MFLYLNKNKSKECLKNNSSYIEVNNCYMNVYQLALEYFRKSVKKETLKIAYGYIGRHMEEHYIFFRHCFFIDIDGNVIDPTLYKTSYNDEKEIVKYVVFKQFNFDDYLDVLNKNNGKVDLQDELKNIELEFVNKTNLNINPIDFYYLTGHLK